MTDHHWFITDTLLWSTDASLLTAINRLKRASKRDWEPEAVMIYRVPGDSSISYDIDNFEPQVEGAKYVGMLKWENKHD